MADLFRHLMTLLVGVPRRSIVAVNLSTSSRQVLDGPLEYRLFVDGFAELVRRLEPLVVLSYGRLPAACHELVKVVTYPTRWTNIRAARRRQIER